MRFLSLTTASPVIAVATPTSRCVSGSAVMRWLRRRPPILALLAACCTLLVGVDAVAQSRPLLEYPSIHSPRVTLRGMVVSQNEIASRIGSRILEQGGNAVDAAIATAFALAVTLPRAGNIGGDGFMTLYVAAEQRVHVIDFRSVAPQAARLEMFLDDKGKESARASRGYLAAAVPGTVAGLELAHQRFGRLPWKSLVEPALALARDGVELSADEAFVFTWGRERLKESTSSQATFFKSDGSNFRAGEILRQPELAWSLEQIAAKGAEAFYRGEIAARFEADMAARGGLITRADLAAYRAVLREPLVGTYRGHTIYTAPPASAGGATLLNMLNILENFELKPLGAGSAASLHLLAETMKLANADRVRNLGDTDFVDVPLEGLTSKAYARDRARLINQRRASKPRALGAGEPWRYESPSTTHFSTADSDGNLVSTTYTLGSDFGSGVMIAGTGILLNNQMNNFSHEQALRASRTGEKPPLNALQPGKRMMSTQMPTLVFKDNRPWMAVGTPGGGKIVDTVLQLLVNVIDFDLNIDEATHQPRISQGSGRLLVEPNFNPDTLSLLRKRGHDVEIDETMGSAQSIMLDRGFFLGAPDPRRPGAAAVGF